MTTIEKVVFTADILRPFFINSQWESATWKNVRWLTHLLEWQLGKVTDLPQQSISWVKNGFDTPAIYRELDKPINYDSWASLFYSSNLNPEVEALLVAPYKHALVIGCEIPDVLQYALSKNHIPFIDIVSHPVRFMEDLLFGFRTNHVDIHNRLLNYQVDVDDYCQPRANLLRAKVAWMPSLNMPLGTALITGQVATDKALISRQLGRFVSLADYHDAVIDLCKRHPLVLFKPHPYQDIHCPSRRVLASLGTVKEVTQNFYYLAAQDGLTNVYAINSGTVTEANYFGKRGHYFGEALYHFGVLPPHDHMAGHVIPILSTFLEPHFWADVLAPVISTKKDWPNGPSMRPSLLRRSLNADWDYGYIDEVVARV